MQGISQRVNQVIQPIHLNLQSQGQQFTQLPVWKPFSSEPEKIGLWQVNQPSALVLPEGHGLIGNFDQVFFIKH